ncbi:MAG: 5-oxoprolinase subunit PxpB [Opitutaceae bacterium]
MEWSFQPYGEQAVLIKTASDIARDGLLSALQVSPPSGFVEYVFGHSNVLVYFSSAEHVASFGDWLASISEAQTDFRAEKRLIEVPVGYNGEDLAEVARLTKLSVEEVVALHSAPEYRVRMIGFSPGFPYLDGLDPRLHLERRASPRNHIKPGTVAIGGAHAGIYSVASPGGWHLLGQTDLPLFQPDLAKNLIPKPAEVFALMPGDRVRFVPID